MEAELGRRGIGRLGPAERSDGAAFTDRGFGHLHHAKAEAEARDVLIDAQVVALLDS